MTRLIVLLVLTAAAIGVAYLLQRRRPEPPTAPSYRSPTQVDRADFNAPAETVLIAVFASTSCNSCPAAWEVVQAHARPQVSVERIDLEDDPVRHQRYKIDGVPTTLVIDPDGVVRQAFFGVVDPVALAAALPGCIGSK